MDLYKNMRTGETGWIRRQHILSRLSGGISKMIQMNDNDWWDEKDFRRNWELVQKEAHDVDA